MMTKHIKLTMRETMRQCVTHCGMDEKHVVDNISVIVDMRKFQLWCLSGSQAITGFSSFR